MAKKTEENKPQGKPAESGFAMPAGFARVTPDDSARCWIRPEQGMTVHGRLLGRFPRRNEDGSYYQIQLASPCIAWRGTGDEREQFEAGPGTVVNLDQRSSYSELQKYADSDGVFDIVVHFSELIPISKNRSWWRCDVGAQTVKTPTRPLQDFERQHTGVDDTGIPF